MNGFLSALQSSCVYPPHSEASPVWWRSFDFAFWATSPPHTRAGADILPQPRRKKSLLCIYVSLTCKSNCERCEKDTQASDETFFSFINIALFIVRVIVVVAYCFISVIIVELRHHSSRSFFSLTPPRLVFLYPSPPLLLPCTPRLPHASYARPSPPCHAYSTTCRGESTSHARRIIATNMLCEQVTFDGALGGGREGHASPLSFPAAPITGFFTASSLCSPRYLPPSCRSSSPQPPPQGHPYVVPPPRAPLSRSSQPAPRRPLLPPAQSYVYYPPSCSSSFSSWSVYEYLRKHGERQTLVTRRHIGTVSRPRTDVTEINPDVATVYGPNSVFTLHK